MTQHDCVHILHIFARDFLVSRQCKSRQFFIFLIAACSCVPAHKKHNVRDRCDSHPSGGRHRAALVVVFTNLLRHLAAMCYAHRRTVNFCPRGIARSVDDSIRVVPLLLTLGSTRGGKAPRRAAPYARLRDETSRDESPSHANDTLPS